MPLPPLPGRLLLPFLDARLPCTQVVPDLAVIHPVQQADRLRPVLFRADAELLPRHGLIAIADPPAHGRLPEPHLHVLPPSPARRQQRQDRPMIQAMASAAQHKKSAGKQGCLHPASHSRLYRGCKKPGMSYPAPLRTCGRYEFFIPGTSLDTHQDGHHPISALIRNQALSLETKKAGAIP